MLLNYQQKQLTLNEIDQKHDTIFILHGLFGSLSNLSNLAKTMQTTHNTVCVDLRNHGNSPHSQHMTYQDMADDIFALADHLNISHFSMVGHSMGGKVAMTCALQQPQRINKLVVADIAPIAYADKHNQVFEGLTAVNNQAIKNRQEADLILSHYVDCPHVRQFLLKSLRQKDKKYFFQFNLEALSNNYSSIKDWQDNEHCFNKKTLFIKGAQSDYINESAYSVIQRLFPNASAKVIENTGHWLHAEKPKTFNRLVNQFLL